MRIKYVVVSVIVVGGLIGVVSIKRKPAVNQQADVVKQSEVAGEIKRSVASEKISKEVVGRPVVKKEIVKSVEGAIPQPETIEEFRLIQAKIFKTPEDLEKLKTITHDSAYLMELANYLRNIKSVKKSEFREDQNLAIDILIEALKSGNSAAAESAILDIIKDPQIENVNLDRSVREALAGVKADVLYQSSAIREDLFANVESILPGPVSQRIWKNIQQKQLENKNESEAERQTYETARVTK